MIPSCWQTCATGGCGSSCRVGQDPLDDEAVFGEPGLGSAKEPGRGMAGLIGVDQVARMGMLAAADRLAGGPSPDRGGA